jgi:hypothetical protein
MINLKNIATVLFFGALLFNSLAQVQLTSTPVGNNFALQYPGNTTAYSKGQSITFKADHTITAGPITINVNSLGAVTILNTAGNNLAAADILSGQEVTLVYDGTNFQMVSTSGNVGAGSGVFGSGTVNFVPKWTGTTNLSTTSLIFDNGTNVGIGSTTPGAKLDVLQSGTISAGLFTINNAANAGDGFAVYHNGSGDALNAYNTGTGGAGYFQINNVVNSGEVVYAYNNGTGHNFFANAVGTGRAAEFQINNASNTNIVLSAYTTGTGRAGYFEASNTANSGDALSSLHYGSGDAINGYNLGTGRAGYFQISNSANTSNSIYVTTNGTGNVAFIESTHATSTSAALVVKGGHIQSQGSAPASIVLTTASGLASAGFGASSTDVKGTINTTGTNNNLGNSIITVTFLKAYSVPPKVIITPASASSQTSTYYVTSTSTNFVLNLRVGGASPSFNYIVIE